MKIFFQIRMKQRVFRLSSRASRDVLRTPSARRQRRSLRSGYAFAHQVRSILCFFSKKKMSH